jgi:hypothetical protein
MEQQQSTEVAAPILDRLGKIDERLTRLETALLYERDLSMLSRAHLEARQADLERRMSTPDPIDWLGWCKVIVAVLLPLIAIVLTGPGLGAAVARHLFQLAVP